MYTWSQLGALHNCSIRVHGLADSDVLVGWVVESGPTFRAHSNMPMPTFNPPFGVLLESLDDAKRQVETSFIAWLEGAWSTSREYGHV